MSGHGNLETTRRANRRRYDEAEAVQLARLELAMMGIEPGPPPVDSAASYVCGGRCPTGQIGHPQCTGRRAA
jgi:hypothetical protein